MMQRVFAGFVLIGSIFATSAMADGVGITYVQVASFGLDGSTAGNVVAGPVNGTAEYTLPLTSTFATDGSYKQDASGYASSTGTGTLRATATEATTCLLSSCGSYLVPTIICSWRWYVCARSHCRGLV